MFVAVGGVLAIILIAMWLGNKFTGIRLFGGVTFGLLGLLMIFYGSDVIFVGGFGFICFAILMISSAVGESEARKQYADAWLTRRKELRDALVVETEPGKIALIKHDLEQHEANAPDGVQ